MTQYTKKCAGSSRCVPILQVRIAYRWEILSCFLNSIRVLNSDLCRISDKNCVASMFWPYPAKNGNYIASDDLLKIKTMRMRTIYFLKILYYNTVFNIGETIIWFKEEKQFINKIKTLKAFLITVRSITNPVLYSSCHDISGKKKLWFSTERDQWTN